MSIHARISRILFAGRTFLVANYERARNNPTRAIIILAVIFAVLALFTFGEDEVETPAPEQNTPSVTLTSVSSFSNNADTVVLLGEVRSKNQAELRAQTGGEVTRVNVVAGQYVGAGTILVEIENASERAGVLSAQGAVAGAEATLTKVKNGARGEDKASATAQADGATTGLMSARESARSTYASAYSIAQDALYAKADTFFTRVETVRPTFRVHSADYDERMNIEKERVALGALLEVWKEKAFAPVADADLDTVLIETQRDLGRLKTFLDSIAFYVSTREIDDDYTTTDKATDEAVIAAARTSVDGGRQSVAGARTGLATAISASKVASLTESKVITGAQPEDIQSAQAVYLQARGALAGALASLERTLVRSPIAGVVTSLSVTRGDFLSQQQSIAVVARDGGQEVVAYVSGDVLGAVAPGMKTLIENQFEGVVIEADPGLDPDTKRARVTIGITEDTQLTNGAFVDVAISLDSNSEQRATTTDTGWYIPITAIKVLPEGLAVFSVEDGVLVAHPIEEGTILGDRMFVREGLTSDSTIVTDVRGLIAGEQVTVTP